MAEERKTDLVMRFVKTGGGSVPAECQLTKDPDDKFMTTFTPAGENGVSNFFEITKFDFGMKVKDEDASKKNLSDTKKKEDMTMADFDEKNAKVKGSFVSWRSATEDEVKDGKIPLPLEFENFSFTKIVDCSSPVFFESCLLSRNFLSATMVKRVSVGYDRPPVGFLKMTFDQVLITGVSWNDGALINETCKFICRGFTIEYREQRPDGSLLGPTSADWVASRDALPKAR